MANELAHWGIKGQKHGQRRFQYPDGTLTPLGRLRYRKSKSDGRAPGNDASTKNKTEETIEQKKQRILDSHSAKTIYANKDLFTDNELQTAYNRLNTEKNIKSLIPEEVSKGKQAITKYADISKNIKSVVDSTSTLYDSYKKGKKLMNAIFG